MPSLSSSSSSQAGGKKPSKMDKTVPKIDDSDSDSDTPGFGAAAPVPKRASNAFRPPPPPDPAPSDADAKKSTPSVPKFPGSAASTAKSKTAASNGTTDATSSSSSTSGATTTAQNDSSTTGTGAAASAKSSLSFTAPPRGGLSSIKEETVSERVSAGGQAGGAAGQSTSKAAGGSGSTTSNSKPLKVSSFLPSFLRNKNKMPAQMKYEISDELREEFERARREQQRLVQQAIHEKKQRERVSDREAVQQLHRAQAAMGMQKESSAGLQGSPTGSQVSQQEISDPRFASFFTDERVEELVQYAIYLGVDLEQQPQLVHVIRDLYYAPLPSGWTAHKTSEECDFGSGFTYYSNQELGSRWQHPREEEHIAILAEKVQKVIPGSRIWFAKKVNEERDKQRKRFAWYTKELSDKRPLVRAGEKPHFDPQTQMLDCVIRDQFPLLHAAVLVLFAKYFQVKDYPDSMVWGMPFLKIAALCPIPGQWTFRFDDVQQDAVYVETRGAGNNTSEHQTRFSRRHPLDAFFFELLKRLRRRHVRWVQEMDPFVRDGVVAGFVNTFLIDDSGYAKATKIPLEPLPSFPHTGDRLVPLDEDSAVYQMVTAQAEMNPLYKPQLNLPSVGGGLTEYEQAFQQQQQLLLQQQQQLMMALNPMMAAANPMGLNPLAMQMAAANQLYGGAGPGHTGMPMVAPGASGPVGSPQFGAHQPAFPGPGGLMAAAGAAGYNHPATAGAEAMYNQYATQQTNPHAQYDHGAALAAYAAAEARNHDTTPYEQSKQSQLKRKQYRSTSKASPDIGPNGSTKTGNQNGKTGRKSSKGDRNKRRPARQDISSSSPSENNADSGSDTASEDDNNDTARGDVQGAFKKKTGSKRSDRDRALVGGSGSAANVVENLVSGVGSAVMGMFGGGEEENSNNNGNTKVLGEKDNNNNVVNMASFRNKAASGIKSSGTATPPEVVNNQIIPPPPPPPPQESNDGQQRGRSGIPLAIPKVPRPPPQRVSARESSLPPVRSNLPRPPSRTSSVGPPPAGRDPELNKVLQVIRDIEDSGQSPEEVLPLLNALRDVNMTVDILRKTKIGVFTQKYKSHKDERVQSTVRDLRQQWKDLIQVMAKNKEGSHQNAQASPLAETGDLLNLRSSTGSLNLDDLRGSNDRNLKEKLESARVKAKTGSCSSNAGASSTSVAFKLQPRNKERRRREVVSGSDRSQSVSSKERHFHHAASRGKDQEAEGQAGSGNTKNRTSSSHHRRIREAFRDSSALASARGQNGKNSARNSSPLSSSGNEIDSLGQSRSSGTTSKLSVSPASQDGLYSDEPIRHNNFSRKKFTPTELVPSLGLDLVEMGSGREEVQELEDLVDAPQPSRGSFRVEGQHKAELPVLCDHNNLPVGRWLQEVVEGGRRSSLHSRSGGGGSSSSSSPFSSPELSAAPAGTTPRLSTSSSSSSSGPSLSRSPRRRHSSLGLSLSPTSSTRSSNSSMSTLNTFNDDQIGDSVRGCSYDSPEMIMESNLNVNFEGVHSMENTSTDPHNSSTISSGRTIPKASTPSADKKAQAQAVQWLCRLFLEQRESLYEILLSRVPEIAEETRDELDIVQFRKAVTNCFQTNKDDDIKEITLELINLVFERPKWHKVVASDHYNEIMALWTEESTEWTMKLLPKILAKLGNALTSCQKNSPSVITELGAAFATDNSPKQRAMLERRKERSRSASVSKSRSPSIGEKKDGSGTSAAAVPALALGSSAAAGLSSGDKNVAKNLPAPKQTPKFAGGSGGRDENSGSKGAALPSFSSSTPATSSAEEPPPIGASSKDSSTKSKPPKRSFQVKKPEDVLQTTANVDQGSSQLEQLKKIAKESDRALIKGSSKEEKKSTSSASKNQTEDFLKSTADNENEDDSGLPNFGSRLVSGIGAMFGGVIGSNTNSAEEDEETTGAAAGKEKDRMSRGKGHPAAKQHAGQHPYGGGQHHNPYAAQQQPHGGTMQYPGVAPQHQMPGAAGAAAYGGAYPAPMPGAAHPGAGATAAAFPGLAPSVPQQEPWKIPSNIPKRLLEEYAAVPLENLGDLLRLYPAGASIVTEGVCNQMSDGELLLLNGVLEQLVVGAKQMMKIMVKEREQLRTQVMQRRTWAETSYNKIAK
ncbi:unnamed protein product [Amoebophrya sp. A120]|nr:unnamed protein product [Amoebophrya sp. A120]|eukprot:GSA120T00019852001.1